MADEDEPLTRRTKKLGHVPNDKLQEMEEWNVYYEKSVEFSKAKSEAEKAKEAMRATIKEGLVKMKKIEPHDEIDFLVDREDASITIFQVFSKTRGRTKSEDLSSLFFDSPTPGRKLDVPPEPDPPAPKPPSKFARKRAT